MDSAALAGPGRARRLAPFAVAIVVGVALVRMSSTTADPALNVLAIGGLLGAATAVWLLPWQRFPVWTQLLPVYAVLPLLGLLRHANGGSLSGYAPLALLPVLWLALYAGRTQLIGGLVLLAATFVAPVLLPADAIDPSGNDRLAVVIVLTGAVIGFTTLDLTEQLRRRAADLRAIGTAARALPSDTTARFAVCAAAREVAGADFALLLEPDGALLRSTALDGMDLDVAVPLDDDHSAAITVLRSGQALFVPDCVSRADVNQRLVAVTGVRSLVVQPVLRDGVAIGVLAVGFRRRLRGLPERLADALTVLAVEAAIAVERADLLARLEHAAMTDSLTGAANRRGWERALAREVAAGRSFVVALLDLDHFKAYNDDRGHQAGDQLLQASVERWRAQLRNGDTLARWGGEEFAVLLSGCTPQEAGPVLDRIRAGMPAGSTVSIGAAGRRPGERAEWLVARADTALYDAKRGGRDRVVWHGEVAAQAG